MYSHLTPKHHQAPHPPDVKAVELEIDQAAFHIHKAICLLTGADVPWTQDGLASSIHREGLRRQVRRVVEGREL